MSFSANYPNTAPSLLLDFSNSNTVDPRVTFTRASTATYFNSIGSLTTAAINSPRLDYDPTTLASQGLLIEEQRTNSIRNNTMVGAVAGTPGNLPTNWSTVLGGLTQEVVGIGSFGGVSYVDIRLSGTTTATSAGINFETITGVPWTNGQVFTLSMWYQLVGGSTANINSSSFSVNGYNAASGFISGGITNGTQSAALSTTWQRITRPFTGNDASLAYGRPLIALAFSIGVAIDITLRIGLPQLELGAFATSVIPTTTAAVTRSVDVASVNTLTPWFNATASTVYFEGTVATVSDSQTPYFWSIGDNTKAFGAREQIAYTRNTSSAQTVGIVAAGGVTNASVASANTVVAANTVFKAAASYAPNDVKICVNGLTPATTASATLPTGLNTLKLGAAGWSGAIVSNAFYVRRLTYYPRVLSSAELQAITA